VKAQEEDQRRQVFYDRVKTERDRLAAELADVYPEFARRLAELLPRLAANDREVECINAQGKRLLVAELVARGLGGFVEDGVHTPRIVTDLRVPAWERDPREPYAWPRSR